MKISTAFLGVLSYILMVSSSILMTSQAMIIGHAPSHPTSTVHRPMHHHPCTVRLARQPDAWVNPTRPVGHRATRYCCWCVCTLRKFKYTCANFCVIYSKLSKKCPNYSTQIIAVVVQFVQVICTNF